MRIVVAIAALALLAGCGDDEEQSAAPVFADLTVVVDDGSKTTTKEIRCDAPGDSDACRAIADLKADVFEPTPGDVACTQQYGGPETATVKGTFRGEPVDARFSRENGCEIARWNDARGILSG